MQLILTPLVNQHELLSIVYLDNYLIDPGANKYEDMINLVRETGQPYYDNSQVSRY